MLRCLEGDARGYSLEPRPPGSLALLLLKAAKYQSSYDPNARNATRQEQRREIEMATKEELRQKIQNLANEASDLRIMSVGRTAHATDFNELVDIVERLVGLLEEVN